MTHGEIHQRRDRFTEPTAATGEVLALRQAEWHCKQRGGRERGN